MDQPQPPLPFGILPTGLPPLTTPTSIPTPTSYIYTLPTIRLYNHIVVFLLPGITLPPNTAAAVYLSLPSSSPNDFKFLGGIGPGKESAIFKISNLLPSDSNPNQSLASMPEITIGISIEPSESVASQISTLQQTQSQSQSQSQPQSSALVLAKPNHPPAQDEIVKLAQKIIKNAFNFLASFSGNLQNGVEVVPLKAFEEWWRRFEGRVVRDPGFLGRGED